MFVLFHVAAGSPHRAWVTVLVQSAPPPPAAEFIVPSATPPVDHVEESDARSS